MLMETSVNCSQMIVLEVRASRKKMHSKATKNEYMDGWKTIVIYMCPIEKDNWKHSIVQAKGSNVRLSSNEQAGTRESKSFHQEF